MALCVYFVDITYKEGNNQPQDMLPAGAKRRAAPGLKTFKINRGIDARAIY